VPGHLAARRQLAQRRADAARAARQAGALGDIAVGGDAAARYGGDGQPDALINGALAAVWSVMAGSVSEDRDAPTCKPGARPPYFCHALDYPPSAVDRTVHADPPRYADRRLATVLYVFATLLLGVSIMRLQGMEVLSRLRDAQMGWSIPPQLLVDELALGLAGLLLAIPGLVTDVLALLVLAGPLLRRLFRGRSRLPDGPGRARPGPGGFRADTTVEGEYRRLDDDEPNLLK
jgi:UPF0716 protein FxsA